MMKRQSSNRIAKWRERGAKEVAVRAQVLSVNCRYADDEVKKGGEGRVVHHSIAEALQTTTFDGHGISSLRFRLALESWNIQEAQVAKVAN